MNHFDEMTALLYLDGQLDASHAQEVNEHVASCKECAAILRAISNEGAWLHNALAADEETVPAHLAGAPRRETFPLAWAAAFALGCGGAYTLWAGLIEPWQSQAAEAGFTQGNLLTMLFFSGAFLKGWDAMLTGMGVVAAATLAAVGAWLLRRRWKWLTTAGIVVVACGLAMFGTPSPAAAAQVEHGDPDYTLASGQEVKTDLIAFGNYIRIEGDVDGDLISFGQDVTVNGHVKGDVICFARELTVNGTVDGNVRSWVETLTLKGTVGKNLMDASHQVILETPAVVNGTMTLAAGDAVLNGTLGGDLLAGTGSMQINGSLGRNANIRAGRLTIGAGAAIQGATKYEGPEQPKIDPQAKLGGAPQITIRHRGPDYTQWRYYWHRTELWGASFIFGLCWIFLVPALLFDATNACKKIGPSFGFGLLALVVTPIVAVLVCFTIVGLGIGIATMLLYLIALYTAQIFVGSWVGEMLLGSRYGVGAAIARLALGLAVIRVVTSLPYAGGWISLLVIIMGLGGLVLALHKRVRPHVAAATA